MDFESAHAHYPEPEEAAEALLARLRESDADIDANLGPDGVSENYLRLLAKAGFAPMTEPAPSVTTLETIYSLPLDGPLDNRGN